MRPYADTNFLCRLYLPVVESGEAARRLAEAQAKAGPPLPVSWLHRLETINAFQLETHWGHVSSFGQSLLDCGYFFSQAGVGFEAPAKAGEGFAHYGVVQTAS